MNIIIVNYEQLYYYICFINLSLFKKNYSIQIAKKKTFLIILHKNFKYFQY